MNISVIFTGGTIGSEYAGDTISCIAAADLPPDLLYNFFTSQKRHIFSFYKPVNTLSENMTIEKLNLIISAAKSAAAQSDAIIITHGTDSLAYSSAALGYALSGADIPIVIVSASHILSNPRSNGLDNLKCAVSFLEANCGHGVFVCYDKVIHRGTRLCPPRAYRDRCESILDIPYGYIKDGVFIKNTAYSESIDAFSPYSELINRKILVIPPMIDYCYDNYSAGSDAVLHLSYHSGTIGTKNPSFINFCKRLKSDNTPIFLHGSYDGANYESKSAFAELGVNVLPIMSSAAAYMKLMICSFENLSKPLGGDIIKGALI